MMHAGLAAQALRRLQQSLAIPARFLVRDDRQHLQHLCASTSAAALCAAALFLLCGCGPDIPDSIPVSGTVTYKGEPLTVGEVIYTPKGDGADTAGRAARGRIQGDGSFKLQTSVSVRGVVPGRYAVTIVPPGESGPRREPNSDPVPRPPDTRFGREQKKPTIPARYLQPDSSDLEDVVDENHPGTINLELTD